MVLFCWNVNIFDIRKFSYYCSEYNLYNVASFNTFATLLPANMKIRFFVLNILIFCGVAIFAVPHISRNYAYRYFTTRDGLAQMQIMCISQDNDGYMWFGTKGGVSRWDGVVFKNYTLEDGIPATQISNICDWKSKKIIFSFSAISLIYPNDSIYTQPFPNNWVIEKWTGNVLRYDGHSFFVFNLRAKDKSIESEEHFTHFVYNTNTKKFVPVKGFNEVVVKVDGNKVFTRRGIFEWKNNRFYRRYFFPIYAIGGIIEDKTHNSYILFNWEKVINCSFSGDSINVIWNKSSTYGLRDNCSTVQNDGTFVAFPLQKEQSFPVKDTHFNIDNMINCIYTDREGNTWFGTENGLYNFFNQSVEEFSFGLGKPDNIWSVVADNYDNIWLGSYGNGLWVLSLNMKTIQEKNYSKHLPDSTKKSYIYQYMASSALGNNTYMTGLSGVAVFESGVFQRITNTSACLAVLPDLDQSKVLYSGMEENAALKGLYKGLGKDRKFYSWEVGFPISLCKDVHGKVRVGGFRGTAIFTGDSVVTDTVKHDYQGVICMALDSLGRLWKGTEKGVYVELPTGEEFRLASKQLRNQYLSLLVYKNEYLIAAGNKSFTLVDIRNITDYQNPKLIEIGSDNGFTGLESAQNGICVDKQGYVWLATALNVLRFNPEKVVENHVKATPEIRISEVSYSHDNVHWIRNFLETDSEIRISSGNKFFKIRYISNSISFPKSLRFKYRLTGFNNKWSDEIYEKEIYYTNLPYGKYMFEVKSSLDGVNWSATAFSPLLVVLVPWYLNWPMLIGYVLILILSIAITTRYFYQKKQNKKLELVNRQKLENELQLRTLRSKVIPHFTKNVLSAIGHFAMTDKLKAGHYIAVFSKFSGLTLANADKNYISLKEELEYIQKYLELEKMRFESRFNYTISVDGDVDETIQVPTMTLHTYCDNAIRHGLVHKKSCGFLSVNILSHTNGITLQVIDDGIGRQKAAEIGTNGNGQGLLLVQAQIDFYNLQNKQKIVQTITDLFNDNGMSAGTKIELYIPTNYQFEKI